jgi:hypothetical protein
MNICGADTPPFRRHLNPGSRQRPHPAASSSSHLNAPGSAGGYLPCPADFRIGVPPMPFQHQGLARRSPHRHEPTIRRSSSALRLDYKALPARISRGVSVPQLGHLKMTTSRAASLDGALPMTCIATLHPGQRTMGTSGIGATLAVSLRLIDMSLTSPTMPWPSVWPEVVEPIRCQLGKPPAKPSG